MGCDWSKSAASFEDLQDAPYSLLSVSVEEGALKGSKRASGKKRDKRRARNTAKGDDESIPVVPKSSRVESGERDHGAHKAAAPSLNLPCAANRRTKDGEEAKATPNKENTPVLGLRPGGLGLKLDLSKAIHQGREPTERQLRKEKLDRYENECTKIEEFMYVGGIRVAQNKELLLGVGITHVINCSAITTENYFPDCFAYKALYMNDSPVFLVCARVSLCRHAYEVPE